MWRLWVAAVECNYQEVDRQLKEQFIHGLNDKCMFEEIIKELTATKNDDHITCGGVLALAKRVEAQRDQVAVLNILMESRQFDKTKLSQKVEESRATTPMHQSTQKQPCRNCGGYMSKDNAQHTARHAPSNKIGHFWKVCHSRKSRVINEMEQEVSQEYTEDDLEMVTINSVCF